MSVLTNLGGIKHVHRAGRAGRVRRQDGLDAVDDLPASSISDIALAELALPPKVDARDGGDSGSSNDGNAEENVRPVRLIGPAEARPPSQAERGATSARAVGGDRLIDSFEVAVRRRLALHLPEANAAMHIQQIQRNGEAIRVAVARVRTALGEISDRLDNLTEGIHALTSEADEVCSSAAYVTNQVVKDMDEWMAGIGSERGAMKMKAIELPVRVASWIASPFLFLWSAVMWPFRRFGRHKSVDVADKVS